MAASPFLGHQNRYNFDHKNEKEKLENKINQLADVSGVLS